MRDKSGKETKVRQDMADYTKHKKKTESGMR